MKLSIITINLNNKDGLQKTIESVVNQTFKDYEYIVIDGASTDGSVDVIEQYADKITYWVSESDKGIYNAMNKGILQAKGEYCLFLNSGDYLLENKVLADFFSFDIKEDIVYGKLYLWYNEYEKSMKEYSDCLNFSYFLYETLPHPATFIKKDLFTKNGLYIDSYKIVSDWAFFVLNICKFNCSYRYVPLCLSVFDMYGMSSTADPEILKNEKNDFLMKNFPCFLKDLDDLFSLKNKLILIENSRIYKYFLFLRKLLGKKIE